MLAVAIGGGSCSGQGHPEPGDTGTPPAFGRADMDDDYSHVSGLIQGDRTNPGSPAALDPVFSSRVSGTSSRAGGRFPSYDRATGRRTRGHRITSPSVLLVEGLFALHSPFIRSLPLPSSTGTTSERSSCPAPHAGRRRVRRPDPHRARVLLEVHTPGPRAHRPARTPASCFESVAPTSRFRKD